MGHGTDAEHFVCLKKESTFKARLKAISLHINQKMCFPTWACSLLARDTQTSPQVSLALALTLN